MDWDAQSPLALSRTAFLLCGGRHFVGVRVLSIRLFQPIAWLSPPLSSFTTASRQ